MINFGHYQVCYSFYSKSLTMDKFGLYLRESYNELVHNVTWPSYSTLQTNTILVLAGSAIFSVILFFMDVVWKFITENIYGIN
jgi:preprotein translocase subunit SecE